MHLPGCMFPRGLAPRIARLTFALRPSMIGFGSLHALSAAGRSPIITCAKKYESHEPVTSEKLSGPHRRYHLKCLSQILQYHLSTENCGLYHPKSSVYTCLDYISHYHLKAEICGLDCPLLLECYITLTH